MMNRNVRSILWFYMTRSVCSSLCTMSALAAYILIRTGDKERVGFAVGIQGVANMVAAFPAAYVGDRHSRRLVIRFAVFVGCFAVVGLALCVSLLDDGSAGLQYNLICVSLGCFGLFMGAHTASLESIFADSVETGKRSALYSAKAAVTTAGNAAGPLLSVFVFWQLGDEWKKSELEFVVVLGCAAFLVPACLALFGVDERHTLGAASEAIIVEKTLTRSQCCLNLIPATIVASDLISMLGAGMTIKYFPLFFWEECGMTPIQVNAVYAAGPLGIAACSFAAQRASLTFGRVPTTLATKLAGIATLVAMTKVSDTRVVVTLFLLRTWLMNCTRGLTKSILNDYVPKSQRARWNAAESVNLFSWSGSAALGGYLIKERGYRFTFLVTAGTQLFSALVLLSVAHLVHSEKQTTTTEEGDSEEYAPLPDGDDDSGEEERPPTLSPSPPRPGSRSLV